ncbi:ABC transporter permease [Rheinheimera sp. NSM]|uniref:ABC transporter permease n=1 Tax=Rheinheimera sp. NSM TaxID=3457884 RepID=UPI004035136F
MSSAVMGSKVLAIAKDEWRYWRRSRLAQTVLLIALVLAIASVWVTQAAITATAEKRQHMQAEAKQGFEAQPDRHPHRMIHYGHYLFRAPPPLSTLDPGIDAFTGNAIFLEGHQQNSATFAEQKQSSGLNWLGKLTPAYVMQILTPLLLIVLGFGVMTREREAGTLDFLKVQGVSPLTLMSGKAVALAGAGLLILAPLVVGALLTLLNGAALLPVVAFVIAYLLYLAIWCAIVLAVSALASANSTSFSGLMAVWILMCLILPRIAGNTAGVTLASQGKLETDFAVLQSIRDTGDGHNANDPAFKALKDNLLAQYNVATVEELPVNFRGVVSRYSEAHHTEVLNKFAEQKMQSEQAQADIARNFGWLSPAIAIQTASMKLAGTDLENYQRFLREAEAIRFDFVQSLNTLHAEGLSYAQDANRYSSQQAQKEATVSSANWQILDDFHFTPLAPTQLFANSLMALLQLFCAMAVVVGFILFAGRRI